MSHEKINALKPYQPKYKWVMAKLSWSWTSFCQLSIFKALWITVQLYNLYTLSVRYVTLWALHYWFCFCHQTRSIVIYRFKCGLRLWYFLSWCANLQLFIYISYNYNFVTRCSYISLLNILFMLNVVFSGHSINSHECYLKSSLAKFSELMSHFHSLSSERSKRLLLTYYSQSGPEG